MKKEKSTKIEEDCDFQPLSPNLLTLTNKDSKDSIKNCIRKKNFGQNKLQRAKSSPSKSFQVYHRKSVTFADEVGGKLTQSVHYTSEVACFDDFKIKYSNEMIDTSMNSGSLKPYFSAHDLKPKPKYNFDNFRNIDNLTKSNLYGLHRNHIALKSLIDSNFYISVTAVVHNMSYEKQVTIHYTYDNWNSKEVAECVFLCQISTKFDIFTAKIDHQKYNPQQIAFNNKAAQFEFAIEYITKNEHFWDNNNGKNFILTFNVM